VHTLKRGILLGLGIAEMSKKQIDDFVEGMYRKGYLQRHEADELKEVIYRKSKEANEKLEARIDHYVRNLVKKEELANIEHIDYLERRMELLEEEIDKLLLEKDVANMSDKELEAFLKEIGLSEKDLYSKGKPKESIEHPHKSELDDQLIDDILKMKDEDLEKLLKEETPKKHLGFVGKRRKKSSKKKAKATKAKKKVVVRKGSKRIKVKEPKTEIVVNVEQPAKEKKDVQVVEYFTPKPRGKSKRKSTLAKLKEELKKVKKDVAAEKKETKKLKKVSATKEEVKKVKKTVVDKTESDAKKLGETVEKVEKKVEKNKEAIKKVKESPKPKAVKKKAVKKAVKKKASKPKKSKASKKKGKK